MVGFHFILDAHPSTYNLKRHVAKSSATMKFYWVALQKPPQRRRTPAPTTFAGGTSLVGLQTSISIQTSSQSACHPRQHPLQPCKLAWPQRDVPRYFKMFQDGSAEVPLIRFVYSSNAHLLYWLSHQVMRSPKMSQLGKMNPKGSQELNHHLTNRDNLEPRVPQASSGFQHVPTCSNMFQHVPTCSTVFQHSKRAKHLLSPEPMATLLAASHLPRASKHPAAKDSHIMCLESPSPKHWISLDTEQWYTTIHSDTIWYKHQFCQGTLPSPSISGRVHAPHAREDAPSRPPSTSKTSGTTEPALAKSSRRSRHAQKLSR